MHLYFAYILGTCFAAALASSSARVQNAINACEQLRLRLGSSIVQRSGRAYDSGTSHAWNSFNTEYHPTCIVFPERTRHVQIAMEAIYSHDAHYAVQAGGHSAMKGWNK